MSFLWLQNLFVAAEFVPGPVFQRLFWGQCGEKISRRQSISANFARLKAFHFSAGGFHRIFRALPGTGLAQPEGCVGKAKASRPAYAALTSVW
jgi:hypothetical protein